MKHTKPSIVAETVRTYYDTYGWQRDQATGLYQDSTCFRDLHELAREYLHSHEIFYGKYFAKGGRFFLDAGCGGEPRREMSQNFEKHVCVDISLTGLKEAATQLGDFGSYILADLAALPFKDGSFAGVLASHSLYHVAKDLQPVVLREFYRVTIPAANIIVFYSSRHNLMSLVHTLPKILLPLVNAALYPFNLHVRRFSPYIRRAWKGAGLSTEEVPPLYSYPHNPRRLAREFVTSDVTCLMTLTRYDTELLRKIHMSRLTIPILGFLERRFPHLMVYFGKFACIRIQKRGSATTE